MASHPDTDRQDQPPAAAASSRRLFTDESFVSKKIILPSHLDCSAYYQEPPDGGQMRLAPASKKFGSPSRSSRALTSSGFKRRPFQRALSMLDPPTTNVQPSLSKRRKCSPSSLMSEQSSSLEEKENSTSYPVCRPKFHRSHSENELSIMKSCELKEEVENILPDSSRYVTETTKQLEVSNHCYWAFAWLSGRCRLKCTGNK